MTACRILKFGGTSLEDAGRIASAARIIARAAADNRVIVVVSALAGVTGALHALARQAAAGGAAEADRLLAALADRHERVARELAGSAAAQTGEAPGQAGAASGHADALIRALRDRFEAIGAIVRGIALVREASPRVLDAVMACGELLAADLMAAALAAAGTPARAVDARGLIVTDDSFGHAIVDMAATEPRVRSELGASSDTRVPVVTGFIAATPDGTTTTLGRGGSDYTASLLGAALGADAVEIWTDVDGVMSADPRLVPQAFPIPRLSYAELMELSHFGAKVMFPPSVRAAREAGVPLHIRNSRNPDGAGTWVLPDANGSAPADGPVRGISSIHEVTLCRLQGAGMVGVPGIAGRLFGALAHDRISVILISQASSEQSICFALDPAAAARAQRRVDDEFRVERRAGAVEPLVVDDGFAGIAAVGAGMRHTPGLAGRLFDILGRNGINVHAIAQGSSEMNISLVIPRAEEERALRLIHDSFFSPRQRTVQVFIAGTGRVGAALLDQFAAESAALADRLGLRIIVSGIGRTRGAVLADAGIDLARWRELVSAAPGDADTLVNAALASRSAHRVFVDCTASPGVAAGWEALLSRGVAVVSANKIAVSGSMQAWERLRAAARAGNGLYIETTVGAALPVLRPIADLVATGDRIARIEGVLSGTLSYIIGCVMAGDPFSHAVRDAYDRGYTEPDPREDLGGRDVARKLLILAREAGFSLDTDDIAVSPALPGEGWDTLSLDAFWSRLPELDEHFAAQRAHALATGKVLAYLGSATPESAGVRLEELPKEHACANLLPGDNLIAITSNRYCERPLVIRGPGAGPEVTAAGVFADIIRAGLEAR